MNLAFGPERWRRFASIGSPGRATRRSRAVSNRLLANDAIEQVVIGPLQLDRLEIGQAVSVRTAHGADPRAG